MFWLEKKSLSRGHVFVKLFKDHMSCAMEKCIQIYADAEGPDYSLHIFVGSKELLCQKPYL